ncbi:nephronectin-like [Chaetodon auriga]|uniref:nephronectin-like n=1 Tax=Chaetodon auriga TaxID=39042 RepID=UPI004032BF02
MPSRVSLLLLSAVCMWSQSQRLDDDSWTDQTVSPNGLCRYGNSVECCWGWRQMDKERCQPHCQQGCKHGECVGPERCKCHPGYTGMACNQDLNECGVKPRPCKHRCMNTPGSYKCFCLDGYAAQPDGSCRNARTCYHANCQYGCEVIKGVVRCTCPSPGLQIGPDRRTCIDIDECVFGGGVCPRRRKCVNTFGSFMCKCHLGFKLAYINGRYSCVDKDTRPFCSLNPASPKCRCKDSSCTAVLKVTLEPQRPRSTSPALARTTTRLTTTATATSTTTTTATSTTNTTAVRMTTTTMSATTTATSTSTKTTPIPTPTTTSAATTTTTTTTFTAVSSKMPATTTTAGTTTSTMLPTTTELDTSTRTTPHPTTITTTTTATTVSSLTITTPTIPQSTEEPTSTRPSSTSLLTTTVNNRLNKEVTHRQRGDVHIPRHPTYNHVWEFDIELGNTAKDAGDDPEVGVLRCTFDRGLCDWMSDRDGDLYWETTHNPAGGQYLSIPELKAGQRSVRGARLAVRIVPPWSHGDLCFSFSHWLTGHHVGVLQLFVRKRDRRYSPALWSRTGGHGWRHTQVTLMTHFVDKVLLKAERRKGQRGQIAVDDVTLRQGPCR